MFAKKESQSYIEHHLSESKCVCVGGGVFKISFTF